MLIDSESYSKCRPPVYARLQVAVPADPLYWEGKGGRPRERGGLRYILASERHLLGKVPVCEHQDDVSPYGSIVRPASSLAITPLVPEEALWAGFLQVYKVGWNTALNSVARCPLDVGRLPRLLHTADRVKVVAHYSDLRDDPSYSTVSAVQAAHKWRSHSPLLLMRCHN